LPSWRPFHGGTRPWRHAEPGDVAKATEGRETLQQRVYTLVLRLALAHKLYSVLAALAIFIGSLALLAALLAASTSATVGHGGAI
jgi:hypothetical protein